jgi:polar amino acid transport system substrate-binding protein
MTIVYRINAGQLPRDHWTKDSIEGGGRIIGEVCHFVDFAGFLAGAMPVSVSAHAVATKGEAGFDDDSCAATIGFADGSIASIIYAASGDSAVAKERVEIFCDRRYAMIDDFKSGEFISAGKKTRLGGGSQDKGHAEEIRIFFEAVSRGEMPVEIESLAATSRACFAIVESARRGGERIDMGRD